MDIVMITRDRPELTEQTIRSMRENAADWSRHRLVVVFDGTTEEYSETYMLDQFYGKAAKTRVYPIVSGSRRGVGGAKNYGARCLRKGLSGDATALGPSPGGSGLLMFSDNDMYYLPGWDERLERAILAPLNEPITQFGGWRHPYHGLGRLVVADFAPIGNDEIYEVDAVTGNCFVIRWSDWLRYGPFPDNAIGPGQSEDFALSQRIKNGVLVRDPSCEWCSGKGTYWEQGPNAWTTCTQCGRREGGGLVATLDPPVAIHCGLVNSDGEPATGWRECEDQITQQLAGLSAEMRDEILIMRPLVSKPRHIEIAEAHEKAAGIQPVTDPNPTVFFGLPEELKVGYEKRENHPTRAEIAAEKLNDAAAEMGFLRSFAAPLLRDGRPLLINVGSGQRRFESVDGVIRVLNIDAQSVPPDRVPDIVCDVGREKLPLDDGSAQYVVLHQVLEHAGCGESEPMLRECWRVLKPGGSMIITVPDMRKLAARWLGGELTEQVYMTAVYGAFMGDEADRHKWGGSEEGWTEYIRSLRFSRTEPHPASARLAPDSEIDRIDVEWLPLIKPFDWREIPGADIAKDFWIAGIEVVKP